MIASIRANFPNREMMDKILSLTLNELDNQGVIILDKQVDFDEDFLMYHMLYTDTPEEIGYREERHEVLNISDRRAVFEAAKQASEDVYSWNEIMDDNGNSTIIFKYWNKV